MLDRLHDLIPPAVIEGHVQNQLCIVPGLLTGLPDFALKMRRDFLKPPDMPDLHAFAVEFIQFAVNDRFQNTHQKLYFAAGASPVLGREGVNGEDLHAKLDRCPDDLSQVFSPLPMSFTAWQPA